MTVELRWMEHVRLSSGEDDGVEWTRTDSWKVLQYREVVSHSPNYEYATPWQTVPTISAEEAEK